MKKAFLTGLFALFSLSLAVQAADDHKHGTKKKAHQHSKKEMMCEKCKKAEKDCVCDHKDEKHEDHKDEKKETK